VKAPDFFGRKRQMMRPFPLEVTTGDFAFVTDHRRIAIALWPTF
jgi:hypothetical protein